MQEIAMAIYEPRTSYISAADLAVGKIDAAYTSAANALGPRPRLGLLPGPERDAKADARTMWDAHAVIAHRKVTRKLLDEAESDEMLKKCMESIVESWGVLMTADERALRQMILYQEAPEA